MGKYRSRKPQHARQKEPRVRINERIRVPQVRVVDEDGNMLGIMAPQDALSIARQRELDLVEISPQAKPPVCKIIDFGKFRYERQKREKTQKKSQHKQQLKGLRFKAVTDTHDFEFKTRHAREFLLEGDKVRASILFRGREIVHKNIGLELLQRFVEELDDIAKVDQAIKMEGNTGTVTVSPDKQKINVYLKEQKRLEKQQRSMQDDDEQEEDKPKENISRSIDDLLDDITNM